MPTSLTTPGSVEKLQQALYVKTKELLEGQRGSRRPIRLQRGFALA